MKQLIAIALILAACSGCGSGTAAVGGAAAASPAPATSTTAASGTAAAGTVVFPADSPLLKQIRRDTVRAVDLPTDEVLAPGKIEANPNRISKVVLPVAGRVASVLVKVGDAVARDQPLLTLQSPDADAATSAYLSAQAARTQARAGFVKAQSDFDRASDLFEHNAVARKDVLAADNALAQAKAAVEQADATLNQAQRRLAVLGLMPGEFKQEVVLRAPLAGKVLELSVVPGEFRNDTTVSVMTIADLSTVWVTSQVPETSIRFVSLGERVEIGLVAYPGETFQGHVSRIADTVDPQTRTLKVQAELDNPRGRFRPEMYGNIHHVQSTAPVPVVPAAAVVRDGERTIVFVERSPGQFAERDVVLGKRAGDQIRVTSGIKAGESIAVDGVMLLKGLVKRT